jgi:uncharacterized membrane protein HdeD (DUF308 family)
MATSRMPLTTAGQPGLDGARPVDEHETKSYWHLVAILGLVNLVVGIFVLAYPDPSLKLLGVLLGIDLLIGAVVLIARSGDPEMGSGALMLGALSLIGGLLLIRNPGGSLAVLAIAFGIYLVVAGALALGQGLVHRERRWASLGRGAVLVAAGTVIISWPDISLKTLTVLAGISLVLHGIVELVEAFALRSADKRAAAG